MGANLSELIRRVARNRANPDAWLQLGVALRRHGRPLMAAACYRESLRRAPASAGAHGNLGNVLCDLGEYEAAATAHLRANQLAPDVPLHLRNLGITYNQAGHPAAALDAFDRARKLEGAAAPGNFDRALALLRLERYDEAWTDYEARWSEPQAGQKLFPGPPWDGQIATDAPLLAWAEQGFGDNILAARCFAPLLRRGVRLLVETRPELVRLISCIDGIDRVFTRSEGLPEGVAHCPVMSLLRACEIQPSELPPPARFAIPATARDRALSILGPRAGALRVGIVWSGSGTFSRNAQRAAPLAQFLRLREVDAVELYSLQVGPARRELTESAAALIVTDLAGHLRDFLDTAAFIEALDLIVMTDTAVAHLAGSLGKPVWNLLMPVPYWIYGLTGDSTPWYPSMRLFRRRHREDWAPVFEAVCTALKVFAEQRKST